VSPMRRRESGDNFLWFAVRRRSRWPGHFQDERAGRAAPWRPVGSLAVRVLRRYPPPTKLPESLSVHSQMAIGPASTFWHKALDTAVMRRANASLSWARGTFPGWVEWQPPQERRGEFVQQLFLPTNPQVGALSLSAAYGLASGRLWRCRECRYPFVRLLSQPTQRICQSCLRKRKVTTAAGLPSSLLRVWTPLRKRYDQRVSRGAITPPGRDRRLQRVLEDLRRVARGRLTLGEWQQRHDRKEKRGRKPRK